MNILSIMPSLGLLVMALVLIGGGTSGLMASGWIGDSQDPKYKIYCIGGNIDVDTLPVSELESDRGVKVCLVTEEEFVSLSDAREAAKRFGGVGAPCSCSQ